MLIPKSRRLASSKAIHSCSSRFLPCALGFEATRVLEHNYNTSRRTSYLARQHQTIVRIVQSVQGIQTQGDETAAPQGSPSCVILTEGIELACSKGLLFGCKAIASQLLAPTRGYFRLGHKRRTTCQVKHYRRPKSS